MPADIAPSPITAITLFLPPERSRATAMPRPAEIEVEECAAPGQDLVRVGLVADVPDQAIAGRIEDVMDRGGQLDHAEAGAEMAAGHRHRVDGFLPQFVGDLLHLLDLELAKVVGRVD